MIVWEVDLQGQRLHIISIFEYFFLYPALETHPMAAVERYPMVNCLTAPKVTWKGSIWHNMKYTSHAIFTDAPSKKSHLPIVHFQIAIAQSTLRRTICASLVTEFILWFTKPMPQISSKLIWYVCIQSINSWDILAICLCASEFHSQLFHILFHIF